MIWITAPQETLNPGYFLQRWKWNYSRMWYNVCKRNCVLSGTLIQNERKQFVFTFIEQLTGSEYSCPFAYGWLPDLVKWGSQSSLSHIPPQTIIQNTHLSQASQKVWLTINYYWKVMITWKDGLEWPSLISSFSQTTPKNTEGKEKQCAC